jgi:hypothetical protein
LSYALQLTDEGSTIYLHGTGTATSPYTCESLGAKQAGKPLRKTVSFVGIGSRAHISCNKGKIWLVNRMRKNSRVLFKNLAFQNTPVQLLDASLHVQDCVFNSTEETAISISLVNQTRFHLLLDSVVFEQNKACLSLASKTNKQNKIFVTINTCTIKSNGLKNPNTLMGEDSIFSINGNNDLIKITINNTDLVGNVLHSTSSKRGGDLIRVENEDGECNVSVEKSHFRNNGLHAITSKTNNILSLKSSILSVNLHSLSMANTKSRFLYFDGISSHIRAHNTTFQNFTIAKKDSVNGGLFSIKARKTCHFLLQNCYVKGEITVYLDGGVVYVDAQDINITIQSSFLGNVHTHGDGGVFYIKKAQTLPGSKRVFFANDTKFHFNHAGGRGSAVYFDGSNVTMVKFHNVSFIGNRALRGGTIFAQNTKATLSNFIVT